MEQQRPPLWAELLISLMGLAGTLAIVWANLPPQERDWIRLGVTARWRSLGHRAAVLAWRAGREGMADELAGRDPRAAYERARALGWWRDRIAPPRHH